ncbi:MAG: glycosyltransferase family protein [Pseudomonas sp.]
MKVLFLVQKEQRAILDRLYEGVQAHCECDLRWLTREDQADLKGYFEREIDISQYERILFFLRFKQEIRQVSFIVSLPNLVVLEHDAYQNYIPCKYTGKFSQYYRQLPSARIISSGYMVVQRLLAENVDACFVPKGYDQALLHCLGSERDIELAFVGSTKSVAYSGRKALLDELAQVEDLVVTRTKSGADYLATLNRIRFFVSADVGMGEYMIKNFEAMACGCVLLAYDHGAEENAALGFVDMHNIVLYRSVAQLQQKLQILRADLVAVESIAQQGRLLAESRYSFFELGRQIVEAMRAPLRPQQRLTWLQRVRAAWAV